MKLPLLETDLNEIAWNMAAEAEALAGKQILVSGGRGFLGRYFVAILAHLNQDLLASDPCRVVVLDNGITSSKDEPIPDSDPGIRFLDHDVVDPFEPGSAVDFVIHAAGIASPFYYRAYPLETLDVATLGTRNLLELAKTHDARFLFMSSSEIYGDPHTDHVPTSESYRGNVACLGPRACYDEGKRVGETMCHIYHERYGVATTIVRPFNVFGPGMKEEDYRVLPNFARALKAGRALRVYGTGFQTRTYCYVTDAVTGFFKALINGVPGEPYNIGNPKPELSVPDLIKRVEKVLGRDIDFVFTDYPDTYPADEPTRRCPDIQKARLQLRYKPAVDLDEGLRRFFLWADETYTGKL